MSRPARRAAGFTLIEVLVAVAIFAIGVTAVLQGFQMSMHAMERSHDVMVCSRLAAQHLDDLTFACRAGMPPVSADGRFDPPLDAYHWSVDARGETTSSSLTEKDEGGLYVVTIQVWRRDPADGVTTKTRLVATEEKGQDDG